MPCCCKAKMFFGVNGAFLTRRWEEPDNFMRITRRLGYRYHSFCADVLDPFFSGDKKYQLKTARAIRRAARRHGVEIVDYYTGMATHRFHGLAHKDPACRKRMREWFVGAMDIVRAMGVKRIGGHVDAISVEALGGAAKAGNVWKGVIRQFRDLSLIAKRKGLSAIYNEQMYIPSEKPWTLDETEKFLIGANRGNRGAAVRVALDVGHQAGMHYGLRGKDLDYREWLRRFAAFTEIIHIQQTTPEASHHWAFTKSNNRRGHIRVPEVLRAIEESFRTCRSSPVARYLAPVREIYLIAEIIPGSTKTEKALLRELGETARFLGRHFPPGGRSLEIYCRRRGEKCS